MASKLALNRRSAATFAISSTWMAVAARSCWISCCRCSCNRASTNAMTPARIAGARRKSSNGPLPIEPRHRLLQQPIHHRLQRLLGRGTLGQHGAVDPPLAVGAGAAGDDLAVALHFAPAA